MIVFETTLGNFTVEFHEKEAPLSVANFLKYVDDGFFDGTIFHRIVPGFVIQGGGFTPDMEQKRTQPPVKNEADNGLKNERGTLSMARTTDVHSAIRIQTSGRPPLAAVSNAASSIHNRQHRLTRPAITASAGSRCVGISPSRPVPALPRQLPSSEPAMIGHAINREVRAAWPELKRRRVLRCSEYRIVTADQLRDTTTAG